METDEDRVDDAVLALLYLTLDRNGRAWKGFDWSVMNRLHDKGMIHNPVGKAKSVLLTEEGIAESERLFRGPRRVDTSTAVSQGEPLHFEMTARHKPPMRFLTKNHGNADRRCRVEAPAIFPRAPSTS